VRQHGSQAKPKARPHLKQWPRYRAISSIVFHKHIANLNKNERGVLLYLFAVTDNNAVAKTGYSLVAGATGIDRKAVRRVVESLIKKGMLRIETRGTSRAKRSTWRLLEMPHPDDDNRGQMVTPVDANKQGANGDPGSADLAVENRGRIVTPVLSRTGGMAHPKQGADSDPTGSIRDRTRAAPLAAAVTLAHVGGAS